MKRRNANVLYRIAEMYYTDRKTQKEIAEELFMSVSNVSRILKECRENGVVSFEQPNMYEPKLQQRKDTKHPMNKRKICFLIYVKSGRLLIREPLYVLMLSELKEKVLDYGYQFEMETLVDGLMIEEQLAMLNERDYAGAIVFATEMKREDFQRMELVSFPCVYLDNNGYDLNVDCVMLATRKITKQIVDYLYNYGHRRFGYLRLNEDVPARTEKERDFKEALQDIGCSIDPRFIFTADFTPERSYRQYSDSIFRDPQMPTAFFSDTDTLAYSAMQVFKKLGYRIPEDISVMGMDNRPICEQIRPNITTAGIDMKTYTDYAVGLLAQRISEKRSQHEKKGPSVMIRIMTEIIERGSVGAGPYYEKEEVKKSVQPEPAGSE